MVFFTTARSSVAQSVCPDDRYDGDDDYQEVDAVQPQSVLDVYRQAATLGGPDVIAQLTA